MNRIGFLFKLSVFLMKSSFSTPFTKFFDLKFVWCIYLIFFSDVISVIAIATNKKHHLSLSLFCHVEILPITDVTMQDRTKKG